MRLRTAFHHMKLRIANAVVLLSVRGVRAQCITLLGDDPGSSSSRWHHSGQRAIRRLTEIVEICAHGEMMSLVLGMQKL